MIANKDDFCFISSGTIFQVFGLNPFHATGLSIPPENIRKPKVYWCFQEVLKETNGMKWVKYEMISCPFHAAFADGW